MRLPASLRVIGRSAVDWWDGWLDMVLVMLVWLIAQVTIVFGPPATFGLYYVVYHMVNGEALGVRGLIEGGRKYFGKAWLWGILNLVVVVTLYINFVFYGSTEAVWGLYLQIFVVMLSGVWLGTQFYALPYFMEQEEKRLFRALKNGLLTTLAAPFFSAILIVVAVIVAVASVAFLLPVFLGLPAFIPFMGYRALYDRLVAFGLRKPEKTPREIEMEESSKIEIANLERLSGRGAGSGSSAAEISQSERQVEDQETNQADRL